MGVPLHRRPAAYIRRRLGLTPEVVYSLAARGWSLIGGPVTLVVIARTLTVTEQGFYYTFWSILGLQILFELGLSFVIVQFASHERSRLQYIDGVMTGDGAAKARLASLMYIAARWYGMAAALLVGVILPAGFLFFYTQGGTASVVWEWPWLLLVLTTAVNLAMLPFTAILEGSGLLRNIALMRLAQGVTGNLFLWTFLFAGAGLYSAVALGATTAAVGLLWLATQHGRFIRDLWKRSRLDGPVIHWREEIWPLQWRVALSWIGAFIVYHLFNPILFAAHGAVAAGRMGMTLTILIAFSSFATAWVNARAVDYGALVAQRSFDVLDETFRNSLWQSTGALILLCASFFFGVLLLNGFRHPIAERVLAPLPLAFLILSFLFNHILVCQASYLRAFKRDPFMKITLSVAVLTVLGSLAIVERFGASGISVVYFLAIGIVGFGFGTAMFWRKRVAWRAEILGSPGASQ
jgi:hypothetical protein